MSIMDVAAEDRKVNKIDWGSVIELISGINGQKQTQDLENPADLLTCIKLRYAHQGVDTEAGIQIVSDRPVVTLHYDSIDQTLLGGLPETETDAVKWAINIPGQFGGTLEPYIIYMVRRTGELKDVICYLRKAEDEV